MSDRPSLFGVIKSWHIILVVIFFVLTSSFVVGILLSFSNSALSVIALFLMDIIFMLILYHWFKRKDISFKRLFGHLEISVKDFFGILGIIITLLIFDAMLFNVLEYFFPGYNKDMEMILTYFGSGWWIAFLGISVAVFAPIYEEVLFRGILMQYWANKWNPSVGILLSSILFALLHPEVKIILSIFLLSLVFSVMFFKTKKLGTAIIAHALNNLIAFLGFIILIHVYGMEYFNNPEAIVVGKNEFYVSLFWLVVTGFIIGSYLWRNWPRKNTLIPFDNN